MLKVRTTIGERQASSRKVPAPQAADPARSAGIITCTIDRHRSQRDVRSDARSSSSQFFSHRARTSTAKTYPRVASRLSPEAGQKRSKASPTIRHRQNSARGGSIARRTVADRDSGLLGRECGRAYDDGEPGGGARYKASPGANAWPGRGERVVAKEEAEIFRSSWSRACRVAPLLSHEVCHRRRLLDVLGRLKRLAAEYQVCDREARVRAASPTRCARDFHSRERFYSSATCYKPEHLAWSRRYWKAGGHLTGTRKASKRGFTSRNLQQAEPLAFKVNAAISFGQAIAEGILFRTVTIGIATWS